MGLNKRTYTDNVTVITGGNLNDIQDAIIALEGQSAPVPSNTDPAPIGAEAPGSSEKVSRADHVHDFGDDFKTALLQLAAKVAYIDANGQSYYDALEAALTHKVLSSISAVYTQGGTVYDTDSLDSLKNDLVVTAHYSDNTTETVAAADYTLSGTLTAGTSTITVSYGGKTTTFNVTVTAYWTYQWDYTMGKLEEQSGWTSAVDGTASTTMTASGEKFTSNTGASFTVYPVSGGVCDNVRHFTSGYGTMEIVISGNFYKPTDGVNNFRISAPISSEKRLTLIQAGPSSNFKWRVLDNATPKNCTAIAPCADNVKYKVKIVMKDTVADIYINDVLVKENQSTSATIYGNLIQVMHQNGGGSSYYTILESLKIHQGQ